MAEELASERAEQRRPGSFGATLAQPHQREAWEAPSSQAVHTGSCLASTSEEASALGTTCKMLVDDQGHCFTEHESHGNCFQLSRPVYKAVSALCVPWFSGDPATCFRMGPTGGGKAHVSEHALGLGPSGFSFSSNLGVAVSGSRSFLPGVHHWHQFNGTREAPPLWTKWYRRWSRAGHPVDFVSHGTFCSVFERLPGQRFKVDHSKCEFYGNEVILYISVSHHQGLWFCKDPVHWKREILSQSHTEWSSICWRYRRGLVEWVENTTNSSQRWRHHHFGGWSPFPVGKPHSLQERQQVLLYSSWQFWHLELPYNSQELQGPPGIFERALSQQFQSIMTSFWTEGLPLKYDLCWGKNRTCGRTWDKRVTWCHWSPTRPSYPSCALYRGSHSVGGHHQQSFRALAALIWNRSWWSRWQKGAEMIKNYMTEMKLCSQIVPCKSAGSPYVSKCYSLIQTGKSEVWHTRQVYLESPKGGRKENWRVSELQERNRCERKLLRAGQERQMNWLVVLKCFKHVLCSIFVHPKFGIICKI